MNTPTDGSHRNRRLTRAKRTSVSLILVLGLAASMFSFVLPANAQTSMKLAGYVPESVVFYAEFELDRDSDQYAQSGDLLDRANLMALLSEDDAASVDDIAAGISLLTSGQAAVFLSDIPVESLDDVFGLANDAVNTGADPMTSVADGIPDGWALVLMPSNVGSSFDFYLQIAVGDGNVEPTESLYRGFTIVTVGAMDEFSTPVVMAQVDDVIAIATTSEDVEQVIDTATGDAGALAGNDSFMQVREALAPEVLAFGYADGEAMLDQLADVDGFDDAMDSQDLAVYNMYGGFAFWADSDGFRADSIAFPADGAVIGSGSSYDAAYAAQTPANALFFNGGTDFGNNTFVNSLAIAFAQGLVGIDGDLMAAPVGDPETYAEKLFAEVEEEFGFNIKSDMLDQMVGEWAMSGTVDDLMSESPNVSALFVTELQDEEPVNSVLADLEDIALKEAAEPGLTVSTRNVNGSDVLVLEAEDAGAPLVIEIGVIDGQLTIGVNDGLNFAEMAEQDGSLADDEAFQQTFEALPGENLTSSSYLNMSEVLPLVDDAMSSLIVSEEDADPSCGEYSTQEEAQAAYDEDPFENWLLDLDFDDTACEDYFTPAEASPVAGTGVQDVNVMSIGSVTYSDGDGIGSSMIILIGG